MKAQTENLNRTKIVEKAIDFLMPYSGIPQHSIHEQALRLKFPNIAIRNGTSAFVQTNSTFDDVTNTVNLGIEHVHNQYVIGHEVGHWFHYHLRPETFQYDMLLYRNLTECIGRLTGIIYSLRDYPFRNSPFTLSQLLRMDVNQMFKSWIDINHFDESLDEFVKEVNKDV